MSLDIDRLADKRDDLREATDHLFCAYEKLKPLGGDHARIAEDLWSTYTDLVLECGELDETISKEQERDNDHLIREYERSAG